MISEREQYRNNISRKMKRYILHLYDIEEPDGLIIEMPEDSIYRSVEGRRDHDGECDSTYGILWMEVDESCPLITRRFKAFRDESNIEPYMKFIGVFSFQDEWGSMRDRTYFLYEYTVDIDTLEIGWKESDRHRGHNRRVDSVSWSMKDFCLGVVDNSQLGHRIWDLVLYNVTNDRQEWEIFTGNTRTIPNRIASYIRKNYKTVQSVKELLETKRTDSDEINELIASGQRPKRGHNK